MKPTYNYAKLKELKFFSDDVTTEEEAKNYAEKKLHNGMYDGCTIDKVYVNTFLVAEDLKL